MSTSTNRANTGPLRRYIYHHEWVSRTPLAPPAVTHEFFSCMSSLLWCLVTSYAVQESITYSNSGSLFFLSRYSSCSCISKYNRRGQTVHHPITVMHRYCSSSVGGVETRRHTATSSYGRLCFNSSKHLYAAIKRSTVLSPRGRGIADPSPHNGVATPLKRYADFFPSVLHSPE